MNEKALKSAVTALLVLVALWGASLGLGMLGNGGPSIEAGVAATLEELGPETVTGITITSPDGATTTVTQATGPGDWEANGYQADNQALLRVWGALAESEIGSVVATNPSNHARMGVSADSTWTVVFQTNSGQRTLLVGNPGRSFSSAYLRLPDEDQVVLSSGDLRSSLARPENDWKDKTIAVADTAAIARIVVDRADGDRTVIARVDGGWTVAGQPARSSAIQNFMREAALITASGFKPDDTKIFDTNERSVRIEDAQGSALAELSFYGNQTTQHAVLPSGEVVFEIPNWKVDRLTPTLAMAREPSDGG